MRMLELNKVKRTLRSYGAKEEHTLSGADILYCSGLAFRLINDYAYEWWPYYRQSSGTIVTFECAEDMLSSLLFEGLDALITDKYVYSHQETS